MTPISIVAYLLLFAAVAFCFVLVSLLLGRLVRSRDPSPQKLAIYECGEPPVGSGFVQFDLRFYVVALVFLIFEVEMALFFPWAVVFGKAARLMTPNTPAEAAETYLDLGVAELDLPAVASKQSPAAQQMAVAAGRLALASMADISLFFAVLLVGFAYVWKRGDLDWVRAVGSGFRAQGSGFGVQHAKKRRIGEF